MKKIKLMADYGCHPLWHHSDYEVGNIDPGSLPISKNLIILINEWAAAYDLTLNKSNPIDSGFLSSDAEMTFKKNGQLLLKQLKVELGDDYEVIYQE